MQACRRHTVLLAPGSAGHSQELPHPLLRLYAQRAVPDLGEQIRERESAEGERVCTNNTRNMH